MKELCCQFGPEQRLAGIVSEPSAPPRLGLVLVSAGLLAKAGPFRLYTELARRLAEIGIVTLRFDLGGIGDSLRAYDGRPLAERTGLEVRAAVDYLSALYSLDGIALGGLCSGAEDAMRAAAGDERVTGVVLIDAFAYRTWGFGWRDICHRLARRLLRVLGKYEPLAPPRPAESRAVRYEYMPRSESLPILRTLLARETHVHFIYTGGARQSFNHRRQLAAQLAGIGLKGLVTLDHLPCIDHTQPLQADRSLLRDAIVARLSEDSRALG